MTRILVQIFGAAALLAVPIIAQADTGQTNNPIQLAQSTGDQRLQGIQSVNPPAPHTQPIGPVVRPYGSTGDDWRKDTTTTSPPLPPATRPSTGYPFAPAEMNLVPGGG